jgi:lipid-A-disaccharide synthase
MSTAPAAAPTTVAIVAGEESGDILGASLMRELAARLGGRVRFVGVGGARMKAEGLSSFFPIEAIQLHGISEVLSRVPELLRRIRETADDILKARPDVVVLVDTPGFNLRVARVLRRRDKRLPIVHYVSPAVWAWGGWRARLLAWRVNRLMATLPFEPDVHRRLGGPPTTYVGHPLMEQVARLKPAAGDRLPPAPGVPPVLLVLPGSRPSEVRRLMELFGKTAAEIKQRVGAVEVVLPAVPHLVDDIRARSAGWPVAPAIVVGEDEKYAAFRRAHAALAASGTVTLELALAEVPMVVAYRVDFYMRLLKPFLQAHSIVLANLIAGENAVPEFLDGEATPDTLAGAVVRLLSDSPERSRQLAAFGEIERRMRVPEGMTPSARAADIVLEAMGRRPRPGG